MKDKNNKKVLLVEDFLVVFRVDFLEVFPVWL